MDWKKKLLLASSRSTKIEEEKFLKLVDEVAGRCTLSVAKVLMKTFSSKPDYGTQERVISTLATGKDEDVTIAILEELPRLMKEAPEWAEILIGSEIDNRSNLLKKSIPKVSGEIANSLNELLNDEEFLNFYPNAKKIKSFMN